MSAQHTPGSWHVQIYTHEPSAVVVDRDGFPIVDLAAGRPYIGAFRANALLIGQASALLEQARRFQTALRQINNGTWSQRDVLAMLPELDAAIAKAEGRS
jgi:hypothetical protein